VPTTGSALPRQEESASKETGTGEAPFRRHLRHEVATDRNASLHKIRKAS
jgi:hypothetical protein